MLDVFRCWRGAAGLDDEFAASVAAARDVGSADKDADPRHDRSSTLASWLPGFRGHLDLGALTDEDSKAKFVELPGR